MYLCSPKLIADEYFSSDRKRMVWNKIGLLAGTQATVL